MLFSKKDFQTTPYLCNLVNLYKDGDLEQFYHNERLSPRQIQRKTKLLTGLTPKTISKISRFYNVLENMKSCKDGMSFSDIAQNNNYSDQSHFIKDFKSFSKFLLKISFVKKKIIYNLKQLIKIILIRSFDNISDITNCFNKVFF